MHNESCSVLPRQKLKGKEDAGQLKLNLINSANEKLNDEVSTMSNMKENGSEDSHQGGNYKRCLLLCNTKVGVSCPP